jgi:hypothetical protein
MPYVKSSTKKSKTKSNKVATVGDVVKGLATAEAWLRSLRKALETLDQDQQLNLSPRGSGKPRLMAAGC